MSDNTKLYQILPSILTLSGNTLAVDSTGNIFPIVKTISDFTDTCLEVKIGVHGITFTKVNAKKLHNSYYGLPSNTAIKLSLKDIFTNLNIDQSFSSLGVSIVGNNSELSNALVNNFIEKELQNFLTLKVKDIIILPLLYKYFSESFPSKKICLFIENFNLTEETKEYLNWLVESNNFVILATTKQKNMDLAYFQYELPYTDYLTTEDKEYIIQNSYLPLVTEDSIIDIIAKTKKITTLAEFNKILKAHLISKVPLEDIINRIELNIEEETSSHNSHFPPKKKVFKKLYLNTEGEITAISEEEVDDIIEINV